MNAIGKREKEGKPVFIDELMREEELRKVFLLESANDDAPISPEDFETEGMPVPVESRILMGDMVEPTAEMV